jgi:hypothetical protein
VEHVTDYAYQLVFENGALACRTLRPIELQVCPRCLRGLPAIKIRKSLTSNSVLDKRAWASTSSAACDVARYATQIILAALAWILRRMSSVFCVYVPPLTLALYQIELAYIICGSAVPSSILRRYSKPMPEVVPPRQPRACTVFIACRAT